MMGAANLRGAHLAFVARRVTRFRPAAKSNNAVCDRVAFVLRQDRETTIRQATCMWMATPQTSAARWHAELGEPPMPPATSFPLLRPKSGEERRQRFQSIDRLHRVS